MEQESNINMSMEQPVKRGRGRPPKHMNLEEVRESKRVYHLNYYYANREHILSQMKSRRDRE